MPIETQMTDTGEELRIQIHGRFDFSVHHEFRQAIREGRGESIRYIVDLAGTDYIDSSALGMLLLLREEAGGEHANIRLVNTRPEIKQVFLISNFQKMFTID